MTRQDGLYWVVENPLPHGNWTIAQWSEDDSVWLFIGGGVDGRAIDEELHHIGPMVIRSELKYFTFSKEHAARGYQEDGVSLPYILVGVTSDVPYFNDVMVCKPIDTSVAIPC